MWRSKVDRATIYLPVDEFMQSRIDQVVMVTVEDVMVEHDMEPVSALPRFEWELLGKRKLYIPYNA